MNGWVETLKMTLKAEKNNPLVYKLSFAGQYFRIWFTNNDTECVAQKVPPLSASFCLIVCI